MKNKISVTLFVLALYPSIRTCFAAEALEKAQERSTDKSIRMEFEGEKIERSKLGISSIESVGSINGVKPKNRLHRVKAGFKKETHDSIVTLKEVAW